MKLFERFLCYVTNVKLRAVETSLYDIFFLYLFWTYLF